jgi:hypothetical protein
MPLPLDVLHDWPVPNLAENQVALVVARHETPSWPSPDAVDYAQQRSQLLHSLADDLGIPVLSWGQTDWVSPREVVQVILDFGQIVIPSLATLLAAWIARRPSPAAMQETGRGLQPASAAAEASVPGIVVVRPDGARLEMTYQTTPSKKERTRILNAFLSAERDT